MVPKLFGAGKSFRKLSAYLLHDAEKARTSERVAWTHTLNMAADTPALAVDEMLWTYRAAEELKRQAGIKAGGRALENPARHFSLNWHPSEAPTREHMIETVEKFLDHMKWSEHQALIVCHTDKQPHVHVMLCGVHPETGRALDTSFEKRRAQEWALAYEREQGLIFCDERLKSLAERTPSPTRATWQQLKAHEREHSAGSALRAEFDNVKPGEGWIGEEWKLLKDHQRQQREQFFAEGKEVYRKLCREIASDIRHQYSSEWKDYFEERRSGQYGKFELDNMKDDLVMRQSLSISIWCEIACEDLREKRDEIYEALKKTHREQRRELTERQSQGLRSFALLDKMYPSESAKTPAEEREAAEATPEREKEAKFPEISRPEEREELETFEATPRNRVRDPMDAVGGLGLGAIGALATIGERLFDGFLGSGEARKPAPRRAPGEREERQDQARRVANTDERSAEEAEARARHERWWQDRSKRWRGRD